MGRDFVTGNGDHIDFGDSDRYDTDLGADNTFAFWMQNDDLAQTSGIINKRIASNSQNAYLTGSNFGAPNDEWRMEWGDGGTVVKGSYIWNSDLFSTTSFDHYQLRMELDAGAAAKAILKRNGSTVTLGSSPSDLSITSYGTPTSTLELGTANTNANFYNGKLGSIAIWAGHLTAAQESALSRGVNPRFLREDILKFYAPLYSANHTSDYGIDERMGTDSGTDDFSHPPVQLLSRYL